MKLDVTFHDYLMYMLLDLEKEQKLASPGLEFFIFYFFIFIVTPCMLSSHSIIIPTTAHI